MKHCVMGILIYALTMSVLPASAGASGGGALSRSASRSTVCAGQSAQAVVRAYYGAVIRHDARLAKSCLTPYYAQQLARVVDPDWRNIATLRSLKLKQAKLSHDTLPGNVPAAYAKPYAFTQVDAEFIVHYYRVESSSNGATIRFIYVVKQHRASPWRIAAIGSRP